MLALLLNDTFSSYHWGCTATSLALRQALGDAGFALNTLPVEVTHRISTTPESASDLSDPTFIARFESENPLLTQFMRDADLIVVNGEGTLHRNHPGPLNLLAAIAIGARVYGKPVHLVNHSCYPSGGDGTPEPSVEELYRTALSACSNVVAREPISRRVYQNLGVHADQGFDCLPLYVDRDYTSRGSLRGRIVVAGGVSWYPEVSAMFARAIEAAFPRAPLVFLAGAMRREPPEDARTFTSLKEIMPRLEIERPNTLDDWLAVIEGAELLITGRFHHVVAAVALGTPFIPFSSNTPKVEGICEMLGFPRPTDPMAQDFAVQIARVMSLPPSIPTAAHRAEAIAGARRNFTWVM